MFVKPARLGSSVGISKVKNEKEFWSAVNLAFKYDDKIVKSDTLQTSNQYRY